MSVSNRPIDRSIRRRQHPRVDRYLLRTANRQNPALLNRAQKLGLRFASHLRNFVEEECAAVRALEKSLLPVVRAGESTFFMTKQVALDQRFRNGGTVDGHVRTVPARGELVDELSRELFSGPAVACDENWHIRGSDTFDQAHDAAHQYRLANHDELQRRCGYSTPPPPQQPLTNSPSDLNASISS